MNDVKHVNGLVGGTLEFTRKYIHEGVGKAYVPSKQAGPVRQKMSMHACTSRKLDNGTMAALVAFVVMVAVIVMSAARMKEGRRHHMTSLFYSILFCILLGRSFQQHKHKHLYHTLKHKRTLAAADAIKTSGVFEAFDPISPHVCPTFHKRAFYLSSIPSPTQEAYEPVPRPSPR